MGSPQLETQTRNWNEKPSGRAHFIRILLECWKMSKQKKPESQGSKKKGREFQDSKKNGSRAQDDDELFATADLQIDR